MRKSTFLLLIFASLFYGAKAQDSLAWAAPGTYPDLITSGTYNATAIIGDTLYAHVTEGFSTPTKTIQKYYINDPSVGGGSWLPS